MVELDASVPIDVFPALRAVNAALAELLSDMRAEDWGKPTVHVDRDVKDLVAHLAHGSLRRVTALRDRYHAPAPSFSSREQLTAFIQADNRAFMAGMKRIGPGVLRELVAMYDAELVRLLASLDPNADGLGVLWAGEWVSKNWFDVAREYTEKWHHQQQIRDATGRPPLYAPELLTPVLETFARGLPHAFGETSAREATRVGVEVSGPVSLSWVLERARAGWRLGRGRRDDTYDAKVTLSADLAWRVWTKGIAPSAARPGCSFEGDATLVAPVLELVAIMA
jgi:hypothetical protein